VDRTPRMSRRQVVQGAGAVGLGLLAGCGRLPGPAQQMPMLYRIGFLSDAPSAALLDAFRQGLREHGWVENHNLVIEERLANGEDTLQALAAELIHLPVDVLVVRSGRATRAAMQATSTLPIVMASTNDPVAAGFVASLARPGGNVTGLSSFVAQLTAKRLELLREVVPELHRVAALWNPTNPLGATDLREAEGAAETLGLRLQPVEVRRPEELEAVSQLVTSGQAQALFLLGDPGFSTHAAAIAGFAAQHRLPTSYVRREFADAGGLMTYGVSFSAQYRRAAYYVDRILKGTKPADLPVEQPTVFDFVINLKTAQALGLTIPHHVLLQATEVIQ
jgi:putative tryptophan/tyrosine transport system substrate-binding protein